MASQQINDKLDEVDNGNMQTADEDNLEQPLLDDLATDTDDPGTRPFNFSRKTWREDMALVVEGRKLYVASNILSLLSPVFTAMFEEQFKEEGPREVQLKDKKVGDVAKFLRCLYPNIMNKITEENVFNVLPLVHEFQVKHLQKACEDCLISMTEAPISPDNVCKYLLLAFRFKMEILHARCVKLAAAMDNVLLSDAEKNHPLPLEIKVEVQTRQIKRLKKTVSKLRLIREEKEEDCQSLKENLIYHWVGKGLNNKFQKSEAGVLKLTISNISMFKSSTSRRSSVRGIEWYIYAYKTANKTDDDQLAVYLYSNSPSEWHDWTCEVKVKMMLINKDNGKHHTEEFDDTYSSSTRKALGYPSFISIKQLTAGEKYVVNGTADINVYLLVTEPVCKPKPQLHDVKTTDASDTDSEEY